MFGLDEAGRGPVLGSMFVACVHVEDESVIPEEVDDSKRLSDARRTQLAEKLYEDDRVSLAVIEVPTGRIDDPETDMTTMTVSAMADAAKQCGAAGVGYADACHPNADTFGTLLSDALGDGFGGTIISEHRADETYPVVSAASILAKDARERHVASLKDEYGAVGSGYPSDPNTREFLSDYFTSHGAFPAETRTSWSTCDDIRSEHEQTTLSD